MRMLFARVSILSVCVLAVAAAPARGQSPGGVPYDRFCIRMPPHRQSAPAQRISRAELVGTTKLFDAAASRSSWWGSTATSTSPRVGS